MDVLNAMNHVVNVIVQEKIVFVVLKDTYKIMMAHVQNAAITANHALNQQPNAHLAKMDSIFLEQFATDVMLNVQLVINQVHNAHLAQKAHSCIMEIVYQIVELLEQVMEHLMERFVKNAILLIVCHTMMHANA